MIPTHNEEDRPQWLKEHGRWTVLNRRAVNAILKHDTAPENPKNLFLDLTGIRLRLAPKSKLTAMEEYQRLEGRQMRQDWLWAILYAGGILLAVWILTGLVRALQGVQ